MTRLIVLDRDGVINRDSDDFIKSPDEWLPIPGSLDAIARLTGAGFTVAVATNQSGLGRGLFDAAALEELMAAVYDVISGPAGAARARGAHAVVTGNVHSSGRPYRLA